MADLVKWHKNFDRDSTADMVNGKTAHVVSDKMADMVKWHENFDRDNTANMVRDNMADMAGIRCHVHLVRDTMAEMVGDIIE